MVLEAYMTLGFGPSPMFISLKCLRFLSTHMKPMYTEFVITLIGAVAGERWE